MTVRLTPSRGREGIILFLRFFVNATMTLAPSFASAGPGGGAAHLIGDGLPPHRPYRTGRRRWCTGCLHQLLVRTHVEICGDIHWNIPTQRRKGGDFFYPRTPAFSLLACSAHRTSALLYRLQHPLQRPRGRCGMRLITPTYWFFLTTTTSRLVLLGPFCARFLVTTLAHARLRS